MEVWLINHLIADEQDIDVEGPWSPPLLANSVRPHLEVLGEREELPRRERSVGRDDRVQVLRLLGASDGFGLVHRRHPDDRDAIGRREPIDCSLKVRQAIAEIGADSEIGAAGPIRHRLMHTAT